MSLVKVSGKSHFEDEATQNYLVFHPFCRFFKEVINTDDISVWKSKGLSDKSIKSPATSDNCLALLLNHINTKIRVMFNESCLKQEKTKFAYSKVVNIYIFSEINLWQFSRANDFTLGNSKLGAIKLTTNADPDKNKYSGYGIGFEFHGRFTFGDGFGKNILFGADMNSSVHFDSRKKYILILGKGPMQGLDNTTMTAEYKHF